MTGKRVYLCPVTQGCCQCSCRQALLTWIRAPERVCMLLMVSPPFPMMRPTLSFGTLMTTESGPGAAKARPGPPTCIRVDKDVMIATRESWTNQIQMDMSSQSVATCRRRHKMSKRQWQSIMPTDALSADSHLYSNDEKRTYCRKGILHMCTHPPPNCLL